MNTKHFKDKEFACKCGNCNLIKISTELKAILELVRVKFDSPVIITSGYRCPAHNNRVGGAPKSKHVEGIAADIKVKNVSPDSVYEFLNETFPNQYGLGLYKGWVHVDTRPTKARW